MYTEQQDGFIALKKTPRKTLTQKAERVVKVALQDSRSSENCTFIQASTFRVSLATSLATH